MNGYLCESKSNRQLNDTLICNQKIITHNWPNKLMLISLRINIYWMFAVNFDLNTSALQI